MLQGEVSQVRSIEVRGAERIDPETVLSYVDLQVDQSYDRAKLDAVLKTLYETGLFADVTIRDEAGGVVIEVRENPVVNRVVFEGNKRLKEDKLVKEIRLAPRQVFTRAKAAADVGRLLELYRRSGRFAAVIEPKLVQLEQNRVDVVFEVREGPRSKVRQINVLGNEVFSDNDVREQMATKQARWYRLFNSNDTYDPDRLAYDQQKLRQYYLTQGYADFRVISAVAELTPDRRDFIISYVIEEGERYKFGELAVESSIRDIKNETFMSYVTMKPGDWYNAQRVEDTVTSMTEVAGVLGYAFADVRPRFTRDKEKLTMSVSFVLGEAPRVYVERIDINGNTITADKVIRREFRVAEGDAFNSVLVRRSRDRVQSLGYFQENLEVEQKPGSGPDRIVLEANVEDKPTGELQLSAGYSSVEEIIINGAIRQRNFRGLGQELRLSASYSQFATSIEAGFTEPYFLDRNIALGGDVFRRDYSSYRYTGTSSNDRDTVYDQVVTGLQLRAGFPLTEYWAAQIRYGLSNEDVTLDESQFYTNGVCDPLKAGRYLCDAVGQRLVSSLGYSIVFDNLNNRRRPSRGQRFSFSQDFAGLGGDVQYLRTNASFAKYWTIGKGFIFSTTVEAGYIFSWGDDDIRLTDRFYLGSPKIRGFDIRGIGPRVVRRFADANGVINEDSEDTDDSIGGEAQYLGRAELEIPLGAAIANLGLRPSIFFDVGSLWKVSNPQLLCQNSPPPAPQDPNCAPSQPGQSGFREFFFGDSPSPRMAVGAGVSWNSPFGPLRIDIAKDLLSQEGDRVKLFQFNIGGQF